MGAMTDLEAVTMDMEQALMLDGEAEKVPLSKAVASANQMGEA